MSCVLPGVDEILASPLRLVSMLMRDDLPTLERPMNAYSGRSAGGTPSGVHSISELRRFDLHRCSARFSDAPRVVPRLEDFVERFGVLHHGRVAAFFDPEEVTVGESRLEFFGDFRRVMMSFLPRSGTPARSSPASPRPCCGGWHSSQSPESEHLLPAIDGFEAFVHQFFGRVFRVVEGHGNFVADERSCLPA